MLSLELKCRKCQWRTLCGAVEAADRLRLIGCLRREKDPDEEFVAALFVEFAPQMTCPICKEKTLLAAPTTDAEDPSGDDWDDDWQAAVLCEVCRQPIPPERLEFLPDARRCVACQDKEETGTLPDDQPEFCPRCGALVELRLSRGAGITRYKRFCTNTPPCRL